MRQRALISLLTTLALVTAACSDDGGDGGSPSVAPTDETTESTVTDPTDTTDTTTAIDTATTAADTTDDTVAGDGTDVVAGEAFPDARCEANRAAGTIDYLTGFDFAAAASIVDVLVADELGYYDDLCLDVSITPSFSTANYPLVSGNDAQFSSAGSFSELATFSANNDADLVALAVEGHVAIDSLMLKPDVADSLEALDGATLGVKGALPPSIAAMLAEVGLIEGEQFETVLLDGFDPVAHMAVDNIAGLPGWKSNEPGALERAGVAFDLYDPADFGIPGSFGLIYTNREFLDTHPTAVEDFMRATMRGLADAIADPGAASTIAVDRINGNGNPNFLSPEGETFRWATDAALVAGTTPEGSFPGVVDADALRAEVEAYEAVGVYGDAGAPAVDGRFEADLLAGLYAADGTVIWPA